MKVQNWSDVEPAGYALRAVRGNGGCFYPGRPDGPEVRAGGLFHQQQLFTLLTRWNGNGHTNPDRLTKCIFSEKFLTCHSNLHSA